MKIAKINKFFGFDLRTGGFIIGWLGLLEALFLLGSTLTYTQFYYKKSSVNVALVLYLLVFTSMIMMVSYFLLFVGVLRKGFYLLIPFMGQQILVIIIAFGVSFYYSLIARSYNSLIFCAGMFYCGLKSYFFVSIYSLYEYFKNPMDHQNYIDCMDDIMNIQMNQELNEMNNGNFLPRLGSSLYDDSTFNE